MRSKLIKSVAFTDTAPSPVLIVALYRMETVKYTTYIFLHVTAFMALIAPIFPFSSGIFQGIMDGQVLFLKIRDTHAPLDLYWYKTDKSTNSCRNLHVCRAGGSGIHVHAFLKCNGLLFSHLTSVNTL